MLTKDDLKAIRGVVREEVENETQTIKNELSSDIRMSRMSIQTDIQALKDRMKNSEIRLTKIDSKITKMHKELKKEIKESFDFLDKSHLKNKRSIEKIENHLHLVSVE